MRPTSKYIIQHTDNAIRSTETSSNNEKVQLLMAHKHSCLTCSYFPVTTSHEAQHRCKNPKSNPPKKPVRYYNICALHSETRALVASTRNK